MTETKTATLEPHTTAWNVQVWTSFLVAACFTLIGTVLLPVDLWAKGYIIMGQLFTIGSTFTLAKTVRDNHEAARLRNRITKAKTDRLLKEFEMTEAA